MPGAVYTFTVTGTIGFVSTSQTVTNKGVVEASSSCGSSSAQTAQTSFLVPASVSIIADLASYKSQVSVGQPFMVTLTVSNNGGSTAMGLSATLWRSSGGAGAAYGLPAPASASIGGGTFQVFTWNVAPYLAGTLCLSSMATGDGPVSTGIAGGPCIMVQTAAALTVSVNAPNTSVCTGAPMPVYVTVNNIGQATASGVLPGLTLGGTATVAPGTPWPSVAVPIPVSSSVVFTYTASGSTAGTVFYNANASGTDANSGAALASNTATSATAMVNPSGALFAQLWAPATVSVGQNVTVIMTVTNTGGAVVTGMAAALGGAPGPGTAGPPSPAPAPLGAGAKAAYVWTYVPTAVGSGTHTFSWSVSGSSCASALPVLSGTRNITVQAPALLAGALAISATEMVVGEILTIWYTVTNNGNASAQAVVPALVTGGAGAVMGMTGPVPGSVASLTGGTDQTFTWTVSVTGRGAISIQASAAGRDANSGLGVATGLSPAAAVKGDSEAMITGAVTLYPNPNMVMGSVLVAYLQFANMGDATARITGLAITDNTTPAGIFGGEYGPIPGTPVVIGGGGTAEVIWTYTPTACGSGSVTVTVNADEPATGRSWSPAVAPSNVIGVAGVPGSIVATANPEVAKVGGVSGLTFVVYDSCPSGSVPVPGTTVNLAVIPSGAILAAYGGTTDSSGTLTTMLRLDGEPGQNFVTATVPTGLNPGLTVTVTGLVPDKPEPFLSRNFFDPKRGEKLQIRVTVPKAVKLSARVYNLAGELVRIVNQAEVNPGLTIWEWDGKNAQGALVGNGTHFVQIVMGKDVRLLRVIVLKR